MAEKLTPQEATAAALTSFTEPGMPQAQNIAGQTQGHVPSKYYSTEYPFFTIPICRDPCEKSVATRDWFTVSLSSAATIWIIREREVSVGVSLQCPTYYCFVSSKLASW